ncbi:kinase-like domain-containing protein [Thelonectria olida]|uniref:Kinase-like domain-containing protein n=1 Tax=Thelonectria olida TaxID=1576542 RepID=A0A9P9AJK2_9HYPO|nr:kinase-like domain-containing protein [Thelonectria olida]
MRSPKDTFGSSVPPFALMVPVSSSSGISNGSADESTGLEAFVDTQLPPVPTLTSWSEYTYIGEISSGPTGEPMEFEKTAFTVVDKDTGAMYHGSLPKRQDDISLEEATACLERVPSSWTYPFLPSGFTVATAADVGDEDVYVKTPKLSSYASIGPGDHIAKMVLQEAQNLEHVRRFPHRNVVEFLGCVVKGHRIHGFAMKRYPMTLFDCCDVESKHPANVEDFDKEECIRDIAAGVHHLHNLGLAHNDINPRNIAVDDEGRCVVIDLGGCRRFGECLDECGTEGFNEGFGDTSSVKNDEVGLSKVREWLKQQ